jgi:hypothetical protein
MNHWHVDAFEVADVRSSFFDDATAFPAGAVRFDHVLVMRHIPHRWFRHTPVRARS